MVITGILFVAYEVTLFLQCKPISFFWRQMLIESSGRCLPTPTLVNVWQVLYTFMIVNDVALAVLPAIMV